MSNKLKMRITVDLFMTVCLLFLMPYELVGRAAHEWIGTGMLLLFVLHHLFNRRWMRDILKGKYTPVRILQTVLVILVLLSMLGSMVSGVILSRHVFAFVKVRGAASLARKLHMLCAYWGFVLMSLHLGIHWSMVTGMAKKIFCKPSTARKWMARIAAFAIAGYGISAFVKRQIGSYLLLKIQFVFFDFEEPLLFFLLDYMAVMGLFVFIGHYFCEGLKKAGKKGSLLVFMTAVLLCGCGKYPAEDDLGKKENKDFFAMDTHITFTAYKADAKDTLKKAEERIKELESTWSVTDEGSEIYAVNQNAGPVTVSAETAEIISFALEMAEKTDGALDPTIYPVLKAWGFTTEKNRIPGKAELDELLSRVDYKKVRLSGNQVTLPEGMELDLGALGKGWAADVVTEILKEEGISSALLDLGGNIQTIGSKPDGTDWKLGIRSPFGEGAIGVLSVSGDTAVVTSGSYERYFVGDDGKEYGHIIDPALGCPADNELASVTVITEEGKLADALSTSMMVKGLAGAEEYWRRYPDFEMIAVTDDGKVFLTEGIADAFSLSGAFANMETEIILR